jgi:hypothetical protein
LNESKERKKLRARSGLAVWARTGDEIQPALIVVEFADVLL